MALGDRVLANKHSELPLFSFQSILQVSRAFDSPDDPPIGFSVSWIVKSSS